MVGLHILILFISSFIKHTTASCTFPDELTGTWHSANKGDLNITSGTIWAYPMYMSQLVDTLDLNCDQKSGDKYLLKSNGPVLAFNSLIDAYICIELHRVSANKYYYYVGTKISNTNNDYVYGRMNGTVVVLSEACNRDEPYGAGTFVTLVKNETAWTGDALATCPPVILASYNSITITDHSGGSICNGNTIDVCSDRVWMKYSYQSCTSGLTFSAGGSFMCLYHVTDGDTTYVSIWNNDTTVDDTTTFRTTCVAMKQTSTGLEATEFPRFCTKETQTSSSVETPGIKLSFTTVTKTCDFSVTSVSNPGWIILILVLIIAAVAGFLLGVYLIKKWQKTKKISMLELNKIS